MGLAQAMSIIPSVSLSSSTIESNWEVGQFTK